MKYYVNWQVPLWMDVNKKKKYFDIPLNSFVELVTGYLQIQKDGTIFLQVFYTNNKDVLYIGYIEEKYLEPYIHALEFNCVDLSDIQTPEGSDAAQYVIWDGVKQTNECGPISIAYLLKLPLSAILSNWKTTGPKLYKRIFGQGKATGTTTQDLIDIFALADIKAENIGLKFKKYQPYFLEQYFQENEIIFSCYLKTQTGRLSGSGVLHWSVIKNIVCDGIGFGWVNIFNPFGNKIEKYSWQEFLLTTRNYPYGVSIKR